MDVTGSINFKNSLQMTDPNQEEFAKTDRWRFEWSSGYAGWRCVCCGTWVYDMQPLSCSCDNAGLRPERSHPESNRK